MLMEALNQMIHFQYHTYSYLITTTLMAYRITITPLINRLSSHHLDYLRQYNHNLTSITHFTTHYIKDRWTISISFYVLLTWM